MNEEDKKAREQIETKIREHELQEVDRLEDRVKKTLGTSPDDSDKLNVGTYTAEVGVTTSNRIDLNPNIEGVNTKLSNNPGLKKIDEDSKKKALNISKGLVSPNLHPSIEEDNSAFSSSQDASQEIIKRHISEPYLQESTSTEEQVTIPNEVASSVSLEDKVSEVVRDNIPGVELSVEKPEGLKLNKVKVDYEETDSFHPVVKGQYVELPTEEGSDVEEATMDEDDAEKFVKNNLSGIDEDEEDKDYRPVDREHLEKEEETEEESSEKEKEEKDKNKKDGTEEEKDEEEPQEEATTEDGEVPLESTPSDENEDKKDKKNAPNNGNNVDASLSGNPKKKPDTGVSPADKAMAAATSAGAAKQAAQNGNNRNQQGSQNNQRAANRNNQRAGNMNNPSNNGSRPAGSDLQERRINQRKAENRSTVERRRHDNPAMPDAQRKVAAKREREVSRAARLKEAEIKRVKKKKIIKLVIKFLPLLIGAFLFLMFFMAIILILIALIAHGEL